MDYSEYKVITSNATPTDTELEEMKSVPFRESIGALMYLSTRTRPDIAIAVNILSRYVSRPKPAHWVAVKRVLRYLKGTINTGLLLSTSDTVIRAYSDADWAGK